MNELLSGLARLVLRLIVIASGLVVFLCVLSAALLLALVWGARAVWARLTGRPVMPWAMKMDPRAGWSTVYRSTARWSAASGGGAEDGAQSRTGRSGEGAASQPSLRGMRSSPDVTDVQPREVR